MKGKVSDPLGLVENPASVRVMFEMLRSIIMNERAANQQLNDEVAKGEKSAEQLRELQSKFGVTQVGRGQIAMCSLIVPAFSRSSPAPSLYPLSV